MYVRPFPEVDRGRWQVSLDGGGIPRWSPSGKELFFRTPGSGAITVARLRTEPAFTVVDRSEFMPAPREGRLYAGNYEVHPDARRLLMMKRVTGEDEGGAGLIVVENFPEELKQRVPR